MFQSEYIKQQLWNLEIIIYIIVINRGIKCQSLIIIHIVLCILLLTMLKITIIIIILIVQNFNRHISHGHHGSKCNMHTHEDSSHSLTH